jgi:hypothetical protein
MFTISRISDDRFDERTPRGRKGNCDTSFVYHSKTEPSVSLEERETNEPLDATMKRLKKQYHLKPS